MRKSFLTLALLATVAGGLAFAGNANSKRVVLAGPLNGTLCNVSVNCQEEGIIPCTFDQTEPNTGTWYQHNDDTGRCTTPLFKTIEP